MKLIKTLEMAVISVAILAMSGQAHAILMFEFDTTEVNGFGTGPYGTVTLAQDGSDVDVTVALRSDLNFVNTGGPHSVFSFNAIDVVASDITNVLFDGVANSDFSILSPGVNTPYGNFSFMLDCDGSGCSNGAPGQQLDPLTFTVLNAFESDLAQLSSNGYYFASDVICGGGSCNGLTGNIAVGERITVPEPGVIALLGLGLFGLSIARKVNVQ